MTHSTSELAGIQNFADAISQYGVKGMKWGVRKDRKGSSSRSAKDIPDDELKKTVNRLQLEQQYTKLTAKQRSTGQKIVMDTLKNIAQTQLTTFGNRYAQKGIELLIASATKKK